MVDNMGVFFNLQHGERCSYVSTSSTIGREVMRFKLLSIVTMMMLLCGALANAQVATGTISGTVQDSTGAVLPGAKVTVQNEETGISRTLNADAAGRYSAPSLNPGVYRVSASAEGFQTEDRK